VPTWVYRAPGEPSGLSSVIFRGAIGGTRLGVYGHVGRRSLASVPSILRTTPASGWIEKNARNVAPSPYDQRRCVWRSGALRNSLVISKTDANGCVDGRFELGRAKKPPRGNSDTRENAATGANSPGELCFGSLPMNFRKAKKKYRPAACQRRWDPIANRVGGLVFIGARPTTKRFSGRSIRRLGSSFWETKLELRRHLRRP
jgi:hypothetical protein